MKAEAMALWGMLWFAHYLDIPTLHIYGDSQTIINHVLGIPSIQQGHLMGWLRNIPHGHFPGDFHSTHPQIPQLCCRCLVQAWHRCSTGWPAHRDDRGWLFT